MGMCDCNGCGGYDRWVKQNQLDFEAWLEASRLRGESIPKAEWQAMTPEQKTNACLGLPSKVMALSEAI